MRGKRCEAKARSVYINDSLGGKESTAGTSWPELLLAENHAIRFLFGISTNGAVPKLIKGFVACLGVFPDNLLGTTAWVVHHLAWVTVDDISCH